MSTSIFNTIARPCLVNGQHATEEWAAECPALGRTAAERLIAWKALLATPRRDIAGTPEVRPVSALRGRVLQPGNRDGRDFQMTVSRPGRPRTNATGVDRARAYRQRRAAAQVAANDALLQPPAPPAPAQS